LRDLREPERDLREPRDFLDLREVFDLLPMTELTTLEPVDFIDFHSLDASGKISLKAFPGIDLAFCLTNNNQSDAIIYSIQILLEGGYENVFIHLVQYSINIVFSKEMSM